MGIGTGVTLIVGGGFHGKSTLLEAIQFGIYNHVPGDGREFVAVDPTAVKIRAEDGRSVSAVDLSPFINHLPFGRDTTQFSSQDSSGSTSQASNIIEALEMNSTAILMDEDTSATNFIIRDARMQSLVDTAKEPITAFIFKVRSLFEEYGVSTIMVVGGVGDYFNVCDRVILMSMYEAKDVTVEASRIATEMPPTPEWTSMLAAAGRRFGERRARIPTFNTQTGNARLRVRGTRSLALEEEECDVSAVEQLVESGQVRAIGEIIKTLSRKSSKCSLSDQINLAMAKLEMNIPSGENGLDTLGQHGYPQGSLAIPRPLEVAAALNRLRSLPFHIQAYAGQGPG